MQESSSTKKRDIFPSDGLYPRLTIEVALYVTIALIALVLRLGALDARLMETQEAANAWQAWQFASGSEPAGSYSPALLTGQALLFALFGASDTTARLWPALAGSAMVLLPYLVRTRLGRVGALATSLILAISPTLVYSARYGDGATLLIACMLGTMVLWLSYQQTKKPAYLWAIAVLDAIAFLADPRVISVLIVQALAWVVEKGLFGRNLFEADAEHPIDWKRFTLVLGSALLLLATALALNVRGLGTWADFPAQWIAHLAPVVNGQSWTYPLSALLLYEPLLLVFGAIGAIDLVIRKDETSILTWMAIGLVLAALLSGGRNAGDVALFCALLAFPAGRAIDNLASSWQKEARLEREGLFFSVALVLIAYLGLETALYARALYIARPEANQFLWLWLLAITLIIVLSGLFLAWFGPSPAWRAASGVLVVVLLLIAFSSSVELNFRRANDPREPHVHTVAYEGIRDALRVMRQLGSQRAGYPISMPVTVQASLGPVWRWYLRDWEDVTFVDTLTEQVRTPMILTSSEQKNPTLGDQYTGQDFVIRKWWQPNLLADNDRLSWLLYRKSITFPIKLESVILWIQAQDQVATTD
ncbi:MAG: glycosyltransferase family 39 protein [Anaerolineae bacterium]|nr:glycosyltransferase family 39 protein [Anaerolineae bacterium]